jgi:hypothetical protein
MQLQQYFAIAAYFHAVGTAASNRLRGNIYMQAGKMQLRNNSLPRSLIQ